MTSPSRRKPQTTLRSLFRAKASPISRCQGRWPSTFPLTVARLFACLATVFFVVESGESLGGTNQAGWRVRSGSNVESPSRRATEQLGPAVRAVRFVERVNHEESYSENEHAAAALAETTSGSGRARFRRFVRDDGDTTHEPPRGLQVAQLTDDESTIDEDIRREILTPFGEDPTGDIFDFGPSTDEETDPLDMPDPFRNDLEAAEEPDEPEEDLDLMRDLEIPGPTQESEEDADRFQVPPARQPAETPSQIPFFGETELPSIPTPTSPSELTPEEERRLTEQLCDEELADLKASTLADVELNISISGTEGTDYPFECSIEDGEVMGPRGWSRVNYMWKASALYHKPLYFEEVELERYGHSWGPCVQPIVSGAHFFSRLPVLPYCMGYTPPSECMYTLGYYRPGSCAPYFIPAVPISTRAGLIQAGAVVGAAAILP